ncbi:MAG: 2,3-bisphosphoglycerate-independent phosphoglycerate mutase [Candidatus Kerfeldbacteria bacterium]|nr:2,3-bisphosphoglycerate-independent phosphoglycerate mutase [Candidatus Kerfeldbacteria bacterium]
MSIPGPLVLAILDGWGIAPDSPSNAVTQARTPVLNGWRRMYPHTELQSSGLAVGLADGQDGNSEAGHMNLGAGRVVAQDDSRISQSINEGTFFRNPAFLAAIHHVQKHHSTLHLMGMFGNTQSAHSNPDHLLALLLLAHNHRLPNVKLHLFTDGRDSPRYFARDIMNKFFPHFGNATVATVMGRVYAMDRNKNWSRTEAAYQAIVQGQASHHVADPKEAITQAYNRGESDEFIEPTVIGNYRGMNDHDAIIFFNLRSDRARQLTKAFVQPNFEQQNAPTKPFHRSRLVEGLTFVAMTDFGPDLDSILTAYPAVELPGTFPIALKDKRQLYIAESEKYAHVTYFFNGGYASPVGGEDREMVASPTVATYDLTPAMSSKEITDRVVEVIQRRLYDVIVLNYANTDMVAHTGNLAAGIAAMEFTDACLGRLAEAVLAADGLLAVTGDHGNLEEMKNLGTGEVDTEHSTFPVPLFLVGKTVVGLHLRPGALGDVAPTLLALLGHPIPPEMTGHNLVQA